MSTVTLKPSKFSIEFLLSSLALISDEWAYFLTKSYHTSKETLQALVSASKKKRASALVSGQ